MSAPNNFEHSTALGWYENRASGWVSMTGSVEFARYKTSAAAGAKLNSALAFSAKAKVGKVPHSSHRRKLPRMTGQSPKWKLLLHNIVPNARANVSNLKQAKDAER